MGAGDTEGVIEGLVLAESLSDEAHFSINAWLAATQPEKYRAGFLRVCRIAGVTERAVRALFQKGLRELADCGIAVLSPDEMGGWEVREMRLDRVVAGRLISGSGS